MRPLLAPLLLLLSCARAPEDPARVVTTYLSSLGRDPLRAVERVTPEFQERHGLRLGGSLRAERRAGPAEEEGAREPGDAGSPPVPPTLSEATAVWLKVQTRPAFLDAVAHLHWQGIGQALDDDRHAVVTVRMEPVDAPPFQQTFHLVREGPAAAWRIDRVEQSGVGDANLMAAFVANPTEALRRRLAARLGVPAE